MLCCAMLCYAVLCYAMLCYDVTYCRDGGALAVAGRRRGPEPGGDPGAGPGGRKRLRIVMSTFANYCGVSFQR